MVREGVSPPALERLSKSVQAALAETTVQAAFQKIGVVPLPPDAATSASATAFIQREYGRMKPLLPVLKAP